MCSGVEVTDTPDCLKSYRQQEFAAVFTHGREHFPMFQYIRVLRNICQRKCITSERFEFSIDFFGKVGKFIVIA